MRFKDRVFTIVDDQPYLTPIGLSIPEFAELWKADKTQDRSQYAKELAYVYHMCEYDSPYYDVANKSEVVAKAFMNSTSYKPSKRVLDAMKVYNDLQSNSEKRALDAAVAACDMIGNDLKKIEMESDEFNKLIREIDAEIKQCTEISSKIELMNQKLKLQETKLKINDNITGVVTKLEKQIESIKLLRERVTKAVYTGEMSQKLDTFIIDTIIDELTSKKY